VSIIVGMKENRLGLAVQVNTTAKAKLAFDQVVARLRASDSLRWNGKRVTREAVFSAVWLWLADMDEGQVEAAMHRYIPVLEALTAGADAPPADGRTEVSEEATLREIPVPPPPAPQRKRKPAG
jgi:hypothetical protein